MKMRLVISWFILAGCVVLSCTDLHRNKSHPGVTSENIVKGMQLSSVYCSSCHMLPDPSLLDSKTWETGVLPHMGPRLGIYEYKYLRYPANVNDRDLPKGFYPAHSVVTPDEWQHIIDYYTATSPDSLSSRHSPPVYKTLQLFSALAPAATYSTPNVCFVKINEAEHELITCDLLKQNVLRYNAKLEVTDSLHLFGRIVNMQPLHDSLLACNIGVFNPTNGHYGKGQLIRFDRIGKMQPVEKPLLEGLERPVQLEAADLNGDGKTDYLASEFGYLTGSLSWYENTVKGWQKHLLRAQPGAVRTYIQDANKDGLPDIWALFAQGEEGVFLYTNRGLGRFEERQVLRFPPSYGSSGFELADFNKDGFADIVYTCGDNADYSAVLKPYHGVYIFLNDGNNDFTQKFFFPLNGCYKALARDFDNDGDPDLACIAYFADYAQHPEEGFVYLENKGSFQFEPYVMPLTASGRWITMDAGDADGDGRTDLILGNFSAGPVMIKPRTDWEKGPPFLLLKNTGKH